MRRARGGRSCIYRAARTLQLAGGVLELTVDELLARLHSVAHADRQSQEITR